MKFLGICGTRNERIPYALYDGGEDITEIYVFDNPKIKENSPTPRGETFTQVSPVNDNYTHWELRRKTTSKPTNDPGQLKKQNIFEDKHALKKPKLSSIGINQNMLFGLDKNFNLENAAKQTMIMPEQLHQVLEIAGPVITSKAYMAESAGIAS